MSIQTGFSGENRISHDGAENRVEYENQEIQEMPQSVEVLGIGLDVNYSQVGHGFRDRYQFDILAGREDQSYRMKVTLTEGDDSSYNVRATYAEDDSQVFSGTLEYSEHEDAEEDEFSENEMDVVTDLNGEVLERRY